MIGRQGDRYVVEGAVTLDNVLALLAESERLFEGEKVVVDFSPVTQVDSSAVSLMLEWSRRARARGASIEFANLVESVASLVNLYGIEAFVPLAAAR
jgi:phospholipid transport system transporter-binding protein